MLSPRITWQAAVHTPGSYSSAATQWQNNNEPTQGPRWHTQNPARPAPLAVSLHDIPLHDSPAPAHQEVA